MSYKQFFLLVKPTSADCNLKCSYCFYLDKKNLYPNKKNHKMSIEVLERLISSYMQTNQFENQYNISWQGGEPTLMGNEFFEKVVEFEMKYGKKGAKISNALQTNGTLIDNKLAEHLEKYKFLVGVSLDGPKHIHNKYRNTVNKRGSYDDVISGINCLKKNNVSFNTLTLVNNINVTKGKETYKYFKESKIQYQQYIPCVEFDENGVPLKFTITGEQWGKFLCDIFDEWYERDSSFISIGLFDSILSAILYNKKNVCCMSKSCSQYLVIEHNGDVYPCDFFVEYNEKLGNIMENSLEDLINSKSFIEFGMKKSNYNSKCTSCDYLKYCLGDCLKHRFINNKNSENLSWLCEGWKKFYKYTLPRFEEIANNIRKKNI